MQEVIALAGRRIDATKFPLENIAARPRGATQVICGAKASRSSQLCSLRRRLTGVRGSRHAGYPTPSRSVPTIPSSFSRAQSPIDPAIGNSIYRKSIGEVTASGDLLVIESNQDDLYISANSAILDEAAKIGSVTAVIVWDGKSRGSRAITQRLFAPMRSKEVLRSSRSQPSNQKPSQRDISGISSPN